MLLPIELLTSQSLAAHSFRAFDAANDGLARIYLHSVGGRQAVGGGAYGSQWIDSLAIDSDLQAWMQELVGRLDAILDLDFAFVSDRSVSNIDVYLDREIVVDSAGQVLALAIPNLSRSRTWWELLFDGTALLDDSRFLRFAFAHELGHALGLEHPFDDSDGDSTGTIFGDPDASITLMSYTRPMSGWPDWYQVADLTALAVLWGLEDDDGSRDWLVRDSTGLVVKLETQAAEDSLRSGGGYQLLGLVDDDGTPPNAPPVARDDYFRVDEDHVLQITFFELLANDYDPGGDQLRLVSIDGVPVRESSSRIDLKGGSVVYDSITGMRVIPGQDFNGLLSAAYAVTNGEAESQAIFQIEVLPVNDPPVATVDRLPLSVSPGQKLEWQIPTDLFVDVDGDPLEFSLSLIGRSGLQLLPDWIQFSVFDRRVVGFVPESWRDPEVRLALVAQDPHGLLADLEVVLLIDAPPLTPPPAQLIGALPASASMPQSVIAKASSVRSEFSSMQSVDVALAPSRPSRVVRMISGLGGFVAEGEIGFASDFGARRLVAKPRRKSSYVPSILAGSSRSDRFVIARNGFTVIADNVSGSRASRGRRDRITGFKGAPADWFVQHIGDYDLLLTSSAAPAHGRSLTMVLLADPFGRLDRSSRVERLGFVGADGRCKSVSLKRALRSFQSAPDLTYDQLPVLPRSGLLNMLDIKDPDDSVHPLISALYPAPLSVF